MPERCHPATRSCVSPLANEPPAQIANSAPDVARRLEPLQRIAEIGTAPAGPDKFAICPINRIRWFARALTHVAITAVWLAISPDPSAETTSRSATCDGFRCDSGATCNARLVEPDRCAPILPEGQKAAMTAPATMVRFPTTPRSSYFSLR